MKTVGQILKKHRLEKGLEIGQVSRITKIQPKYLDAIENDEYNKLPSSAIARGFIKNYGQAIDLSPLMLLSLFRRDFMEDKSGQIVPRSVFKPVSVSPISWTPKNTLVAAVVFVVILLGAYMIREYKVLVSPPSIDLKSPKQNAQIKGNKLEVVGKTDSQAVLFINDEKINLNPDGTFSYTLSVVPGDNTITLKAQSTKGKTQTITRTVEVIE